MWRDRVKSRLRILPYSVLWVKKEVSTECELPVRAEDKKLGLGHQMKLLREVRTRWNLEGQAMIG